MGKLAKLKRRQVQTTYLDSLFQEWGWEEPQQEVQVLLAPRQQQQFPSLEARQGGPWP